MLATYLAVIIPMGLFNLVGSPQNIESAEAAGDKYPVGTIIRGRCVMRDGQLLDSPIGEPVRFLETLPQG